MIVEKRPEFATRDETIIFYYDKARPLVAKPFKNDLKNSGGEVLLYPLYSPDLASSNYRFFRWM